ncbi:hypothetical protein [Paenibacillus tepidiphilus]|uniref:hypothetical protein n=1 Tax=Paenibacillus tepidiphilus TaxID=2608683 RepID=UPI0012394512|nr:hypothetical protein [Paenibacillus tepidiphilus]
MTIESLVVKILNIAFYAIGLWFLYYVYQQRRLKKKGTDAECVYDPARIIPHTGLLAVITLYVTLVTVLWVLCLLGLSDWITGHWFSHVYPLVLPVAVNHERVVMIIDSRGIFTDHTVIPMKQISSYELKDSGTAGGRQILEVQAGEQVLRGWVRAESLPAIRALLEPNPG